MSCKRDLIISSFYFLLAIQASSSQKPTLELRSTRETLRGNWSYWEYCRSGQYAAGFQLKVAPMKTDARADDTALNGIKLLCVQPDRTGAVQSQASSAEGPWGTWKNVHLCPGGGFLTGFQLRTEHEQGVGDDTAANNLRGRCGESVDFVEGDGLDYGHWTEPLSCPQGSAIYAVQTQVEQPRGKDSDNTALNNVNMLCGSLPAAPQARWDQYKSHPRVPQHRHYERTTE